MDLRGLREDELRTAIGPRADSYLKKWQATERGGFNWAAFFLSGLWLPYRKMYRLATIVLAAVIVESMAEDLIFLGWMRLQDTPPAVGRAVGAAVAGICGVYGNRWYLAHVRRLIDAEPVRSDDPAGRLASLARKGGTSVLAAIGFFAAFLILAILATLLIDALIGQS